MSDNPNYRLQRKIDAARERADVSIDPADHALYHALKGAENAEIYAIERAAHEQHCSPENQLFQQF